MSAKKAKRQELYEALAVAAGFTVVAEQEQPNRLCIKGRIPNDRMPFWLPVMFTLRKAEKTAPWKCDISKEYFESNDRILYAWRLILQGADLDTHYGAIAAVIRSAPRPARVEVDTVLLPGYRAGQVRGGVNARGKGSMPADSAPMIVTRRTT